MKIKEGFVLREIAGEYVVIALGSASRIFNGMIKLNESGCLIWKKLSEGCEKEEVIDAVLAEYDAPRSIIAADVERIINQLKGANILE